MIQLDLTSDVPPFTQIKRQIVDHIARGQLPVGDKLPPIRVLAQELGVAVNTVARSYRELEDEGYVITQGRAGTRVSARAVSKELALAQHARAYVAIAREAGATDDEALDVVRTYLKEITQ
ncbi:GntR family transcriptional regulator [Jonesia quinghaiensis]|uniref:GntR family transcriptional regulator n=1 Tax=Jonesia quinghaiensis TaxID=262806 RepID=UPI0004224319|nr:GntR family transcriptional regulator [Jonesia quinghaiensis]